MWASSLEPVALALISINGSALQGGAGDIDELALPAARATGQQGGERTDEVTKKGDLKTRKVFGKSQSHAFSSSSLFFMHSFRKYHENLAGF